MSVDLFVTDGICPIKINRPERHNAMDGEHYRLLSEAWTKARDDTEIRVAIITGAGEKTFTAGADLKNLQSVFQPEDMWLTQKDQLLNRGLEVWKPVISAVNGNCHGLCGADRRKAKQFSTFIVAPY